MSDARRSAFLDSSVTLPGLWEGNESLLPLDFRYRPMNAVENAGWVRRISEAKGPDAIAETVCEMLADRLTVLREWDPEKSVFHEVAHTSDDLLKLDANALYALQRIIERSAQTLEEARKNY